MVREIEFRAKDLNGNWVFGFYSPRIRFPSFEQTPNIKTFKGADVEININTLGQYTGLKDKNGTKIFEGDIVRILYTDWASKSDNDPRTLDEYLRDIAKIGVVEWDRLYPQFHIHFMCRDNYNSLYCGKYGYIEVIGNVIDNPELLGE